MIIKDYRTAREFIWSWHLATRSDAFMRRSEAAVTRMIQNAANDLERSLSVMNATPGRYTFSERADLVEAIAELRHGFHPYATPPTGV